MKRYKEYFIGGPLHGKDKTEEFPGPSTKFSVRHDEFWTFDEVDQNHELSPYIVPGTKKAEWLYTPERFTFGGVFITIWADFRLTSREVVLVKLAELLMAPHERHDPEKCVCSDSVHSSTGLCPSKYSSGYELCPRRHYSEEAIIALTKKSIPQNETETES